jgi:hypothetical protein
MTVTATADMRTDRITLMIGGSSTMTVVGITASKMG